MVGAPIIYYWSHPNTRNTEEVARRIERELGIEVRHILNSKKEADSPYVLMTPTYEGKVDARDPYIPNAVKRWLKASRARRQLIVGVIGTGNLNFGAEYCMALKCHVSVCVSHCSIALTFVVTMTITRYFVKGLAMVGTVWLR